MAASVRAFGNFPVSYGTSLALEGLYALERPVEPSGSAFIDAQRQKMIQNNRRHLRNGRRIDTLWINLETLIRNVMEAYTKEDNPTVQQVVDSVYEDMEFIHRLVSEESSDTTQVVVYLEDASERKWVFPHAQWRKPTTKLQLEKHYQQQTALRMLSGATTDGGFTISTIRRFPHRSQLGLHSTTLQQTALLLTHFPHQLFWARDFKYLLLLESHTGMIKDRSQWSSKLKGVSDKDGIPFNPFTLQVLGDSHLFSGESRVIQRELKTLADKRKWSSITGRERMMADLRASNNVILQEVYNKTMTAF